MWRSKTLGAVTAHRQCSCLLVVHGGHRVRRRSWSRDIRAALSCLPCAWLVGFLAAQSPCNRGPAARWALGRPAGRPAGLGHQARLISGMGSAPRRKTTCRSQLSGRGRDIVTRLGGTIFQPRMGADGRRASTRYRASDISDSVASHRRKTASVSPHQICGSNEAASPGLGWPVMARTVGFPAAGFPHGGSEVRATVPLYY